jgi:hypothetical protein
VKVAVEFQVLRREAQNVEIFRRTADSTQAFVQVVVVLEKGAPGAVSIAIALKISPTAR